MGFSKDGVLQEERNYREERYHSIQKIYLATGKFGVEQRYEKDEIRMTKCYDPSNYGLPLGALDDDPGVKPKFHVFVANKAPWFDITDELPQFPELPKKAP